MKKTHFILLGGLLSCMIATSASAYGWHHGGGYYPHGGYYHHGYYHGGDNLAAGLVVGGMFGLMAGAAIASQPSYYPAPACYQEPVWTRQFCDSYGCYDRTAWRTVCH